MAIYLFAAGANYKGQGCELPDCDLDVDRMAADFEALKLPKSGVVRLFEREATYDNLVRRLKAFIGKLKSGDLGLVFWSGHGTTDRVDGKSVQAIVTYDLRALYEATIREICADRALGVMLGLAADSCYSGGLPRSRHPGLNRSVPPSFLRRDEVAKLPTKAPPKLSFAFQACSGTETASSTGTGGAWSLAFHEAWTKRTDTSTVPWLHDRIKRQLPSREYPQHPQFQCAPVLKNRTIKSFGKK